MRTGCGFLRVCGILLLLLASPPLIVPALAQATIHARLDRFSRSYDLHADLTYVETVDVDYTLLDARGLSERERSSFSFYPASQSLQVIEAWVQQPDGTHIDVPASGRFTRPSAAAQNAPGFTGADDHDAALSAGARGQPHACPLAPHPEDAAAAGFRRLGRAAARHPRWAWVGSPSWRLPASPCTGPRAAVSR